MSLLSETVSNVIACQQLTLQDLGTISLSAIRLNTDSLVVLREMLLYGKQVKRLHPVITVSDQADIAALINGFTFENGSTPMNTVSDVAGNETKYLAVGEVSGSAPVMSLSTDGLNWEEVENPPGGGSVGITAIAYDNSLWQCATVDPVQYYSSPDGVSWSQGTGYEFTTRCNGLVFAQNKWVSVGASNGFTQAYSLDGINWNSGTGTLFTDAAVAVAASNDLFVAVGASTGNNPTLLVSVDGMFWTTPLVAPTFTTGSSVAVNSEGTMWVAVGENAPLQYSTDGLEWKSSGFTGLVNASKVCYDGTKFIVVSPQNMTVYDVAFSLDGIHWQLSTSNTFGAVLTNIRANTYRSTLVL